MHFLPIFAATLATVAANPLPAVLEERQATCANNAAARILRNLGNNGGIFCSSLLNIPAITVPITLPAVTSTVTLPSSTQITGPCLPIIGKREAEAEAEAVGSLSALAGSQITAGCSCLSLTTRTTTSTVTLPPIPTTAISGIFTTCTPAITFP